MSKHRHPYQYVLDRACLAFAGMLLAGLWLGAPRLIVAWLRFWS